MSALSTPEARSLDPPPQGLACSRSIEEDVSKSPNVPLVGKLTLDAHFDKVSEHVAHLLAAGGH